MPVTGKSFYTVDSHPVCGGCIGASDDDGEEEDDNDDDGAGSS